MPQRQFFPGGMPLCLLPCELVHIMQQLPTAYVNWPDRRPVHDDEGNKEEKKKAHEPLLYRLQTGITAPVCNQPAHWWAWWRAPKSSQSAACYASESKTRLGLSN